MLFSVICHVMPINQIMSLHTKNHMHVFDVHTPCTMNTTISVQYYVCGSNMTMICLVESLKHCWSVVPCQAEDRLRSLRPGLERKMICGWLGNLIWSKSSNNSSFAREIRKSSQQDGFPLRARFSRGNPSKKMCISYIEL